MKINNIRNIFVQETDLDSLPGLLFKDVGHFFASLVHPKMEIFQMNGLLGFSDIFHQKLQFAPPGSNDFERVSFRKVMADLDI